MNFEDNDGEFHGQGPAHIIAIQEAKQREYQAWHQMQMMEIKTSMENFLDGLSAEQCLELSRMVQLFTANPQYMHIVIGQLSVMMRLVHKVCSMCGDTKHSTVEHLTAEQSDLTMNAPSDYGWLAGLSPSEQVERMYVREHVNEAGAYVCNNCDSEFSTLFARASQGKDCPVCRSRARLNEGVDDAQLDVGACFYRYRVAESRTKEDVMVCVDCGQEFESMKFRMQQGLNCPTCEIQSEVKRDEGPSGTS